MRSGSPSRSYPVLILLWAVLSSGCGPSRPSVSLPGAFPPGPGETEELPAPAASPIDALSRAETEGPSDWVSETMERMTLEEKVAQMVFVRSIGYYQNDDSPATRRLLEMVRGRKVGGVCLFQGDIHTSAVLINRLQEAAGIPLLVASDFEWGAAMRLRRSTRFPEAMALGAARDTGLAYRMGRRIGLEARSLGIHQVYAPVCDVNNNADNPVINTRSFGENPALVAEMSSAVARGIQSAGVLATAKHFPGHGDTDVDSHLGLPFMKHSRGRLDSVELVPFRALVDQGIASVMVAHCEVPSLGGPSGRPATLSPNAIDSLLVRDMRFRGMVVTDAMEMKGLSKNFGADSAAVLAVEAGNDVLLLPADEDATIGALLAAVRSGRIGVERIDRSVRKILTLKEWAGLARNRYSDIYGVSSVIAGEEARRLSREIARKSVTLLKNDRIIPLGMRMRRLLHVVIADVEEYRTEINRPEIPWPNERAGEYLAGLVRARWKATQTVRLDPGSTPAQRDSAAVRASKADVVLLSVFSKARTATGAPGLPESLIVTVRKILAANPRSVLVSFGSPYVLSSLPGAGSYMCAYSDAEASSEAVAQALFGESSLTGYLPVTIPGMYPYGAGIRTDQLALRHESPGEAGLEPELTRRVDSVVMAAISDSAFPGAQLLVVDGNRVMIDRSYGHFTYDPASSGVAETSRYDIASMTKVIATTAAMMRLYDEGKWRPDDRVVRFLPRFTGGGRDSVTLRHLLTHTSGLPPFRRYFLTCRTPGQLLDSVYSTDLIAAPGDSVVYSDFGFILLGRIAGVLGGVPLDRYVDSVFFRPLGMAHTGFRPSGDGMAGDTVLSAAGDFAPTEYDSLYRGRLVQGDVHDENAYALGGVAGHAGLFSTASDLAIFMQMLLNGGSYAGEKYLSWETVRLFTDRTDTGSVRGLGWDFRSPDGYTSSGKYFGMKAFGHTGFTGTSVWADPEKKIFIIFLTNRVYPTRNNQRIRFVRPAVHDAVMEALQGRDTRLPR